MCLNIVGGVRVEDPAADLGVALAVASSFLDKPIPSDMAVLERWVIRGSAQRQPFGPAAARGGKARFQTLPGPEK